MAVKIDLSDKGYFSLGKRGFSGEESDSSVESEINKFVMSESILNLNISKNKLTELPSEISQLSNLRDVDLSDNCLKSIPQVLQNLSSLIDINLANNSISISDQKSLNLGEDFEFLKPKLENKLELANPEDSIYSEEDLVDSSSCSFIKPPNKSDSVDSGILLMDNSFDFSNLTRLTNLNLSQNEIQFFPESLSELPNLQLLNLSHNYLTCLPTVLKSAQCLRYLDISWNRLVEVPMWVGELTKCIKFSVSGNPIGDAMEFPDHFGLACKRIKYLEMENTFIRNFPSSLTSLLDLRHLKVSNKKNSLSDTVKSKCTGYFERESSWDFFGNKKYSPFKDQDKDRFLHRNSLWTFPASFSNFVGLVKLEAVNVGLADLPEALGKLVHLKILDVSKNNLSWIPKSFIDLSNLEFCNFSRNSILMLPLDLETMPNLTHLLAAFNMIAELPENLHQLKSLLTLDVYENQISAVPSKIIENDLRRFDMAQNDITDTAFKDQTKSDDFKKYLILQANLRSWDGVLLENQAENYELDISLFQDRLDFRQVKVEERIQYQANMNDLLKAEDEEEPEGGEDFHGNVDDNYMECEDKEDESPAISPSVSDTEIEDWTNHLEPYSPPKLSYCHNLLRMDQENWWGRNQFCPADLHATPRNEKILKNVERDRQMRMMRHVGRWGRRERQSTSLPLLKEGQFEDIE